eukprot:gene1736-33146_t
MAGPDIRSSDGSSEAVPSPPAPGRCEGIRTQTRATGTTTFPYCGCYEASCGVKVDSFVVSDPSDEVQQLSFRITADADCPRTNR